MVKIKQIIIIQWYCISIVKDCESFHKEAGETGNDLPYSMPDLFN